MQQSIISFTLEIVVSITSAAVMFVIGRFWTSLIMPMLKHIFQGESTLLAPVYTGHFKLNDQDVHDLIELRQRANRVWGTMTFPQGRQGKYNFEATILDNVLRGTFDGVLMNPHARGSFLLAVLPGSRDLQGWFVEPYEGKVLAFEYRWAPTQY